MIIHHNPVILDGTNGGVVAVNPDLPSIQISVSGRTSGTLTFTGRSFGSDVYEAFQPALTLDLSTERTAVVDGYSLDSLSVAVSVGGDDFDVTISQWYTQ